MTARCDGCGRSLPDVVFKVCEAVAFYTGKGVECPGCTGTAWTFEPHVAKRDPQGVPAVRQD